MREDMGEGYVGACPPPSSHERMGINEGGRTRQKLMRVKERK